MSELSDLTLRVATDQPVLGQAAPADSTRHFRFFLWNDFHVRHREPRYPNCNAKADWAVRCARGLESIAPPDFVVSAGDLICGGSEFDDDFRSLQSLVIEPLDMPLLPCLGNNGALTFAVHALATQMFVLE